MKKISVVFSFRNEENNIPELVNRTSAAIEKIDNIQYELIFVNDDSNDSSLDVLMELQHKFPIKIINMSRRFGVTPCVLAGMVHSSGDAVIYLDSDLQDPPELIGQLFQKFLEGYDVVHTRRTQRLGESKFKMLLTRFAYKIINFFSDIDLPTNVGDFKLLSRRAVNHVIGMKEIDPYMRGISIWIGFKQYYIDYVRDPRLYGDSKMPLLGKGPVLEFIRGVTAYSAGPLYIAIALGLCSIIFSLILIIYAIFIKLFGLTYIGVPAILVAVSFFSGILLFTNGLIGLYVSKIYFEVKARPQYIISSILENEQNN